MAKELTVALAPNVWRIRLIRDLVNGFIIRDADGQVTLVDMGVKQSGPKVLEALAGIGSGPSDVTRLLLTHCHPDHAGGAAHVSEQTGKPVDVHADDAHYVRSGTQPDPDPRFRTGRLLRKVDSGTLDPVTVGEELHHGQLIDVGGGIRVIHTPGHSPGHVSYLLEDHGVLITGDAIFNVFGLRWPIKALCSNFAMTQETAHRLVETPYDVAAFTHGPEMRDDPRRRIGDWLRKQRV